MAIIFTDGFDKYGPTNYPGTSSLIVAEWTIAGSGLSIQAPLSSTGHSIAMAGTSVTMTSRSATVNERFIVVAVSLSGCDR